MKIKTLLFFFTLLSIYSCSGQLSKTNFPLTVKDYELCDSIGDSPETYRLNCECIQKNHCSSNNDNTSGLSYF